MDVLKYDPTVKTIDLGDERMVKKPDMQGYGTSEGVEKAWDTRGRGRHPKTYEGPGGQKFTIPEDEPESEVDPALKGKPAYRGVTSDTLNGIFKEGAIWQGPHEMHLISDWAGPFSSQKGVTYVTYDKKLAKSYAELKDNFNHTEPGHEFATPWGAWGDMKFIKPSDAPQPILDSKPALITMKLPENVEHGLKYDRASAPENLSYMYPGKIPAEAITNVQILDGGHWKKYDWKKSVHAEQEGGRVVHLVWYGTMKELEDFLRNRDVKAASMYRGIPMVGFTAPQEEIIRATASRVPPELMFNVHKIVAAPELDAKHGRFDPETKTVYINPHEFALRQRFGEGPGWIHHMELTMVHEFMHSIYAFLPELVKDQWRDLSGWMIGTKDGQDPPYVEKRPGWEIGKTSKWTHRKFIKFPRHYSERNDDEDFADCAAYMLLGKGHMVDLRKKQWLHDLFSSLVKKYPTFTIESPDKAYGEREVAYKNDASN